MEAETKARKNEKPDVLDKATEIIGKGLDALAKDIREGNDQMIEKQRERDAEKIAGEEAEKPELPLVEHTPPPMPEVKDMGIGTALIEAKIVAIIQEWQGLKAATDAEVKHLSESPMMRQALERMSNLHAQHVALEELLPKEKKGGK